MQVATPTQPSLSKRRRSSRSAVNGPESRQTRLSHICLRWHRFLTANGLSAEGSEKQIEVLEPIIESSRNEVRLVARAKIIWNAFYGKRNDEISKIVGPDRGYVAMRRLDQTFQRQAKQEAQRQAFSAMSLQPSQSVRIFPATKCNLPQGDTRCSFLRIQF